MNNPLAYYAALSQRSDLDRTSRHPSRLMRHELRYAGKPGRRGRRGRS